MAFAAYGLSLVLLLRISVFFDFSHFGVCFGFLGDAFFWLGVSCIFLL